MGVTDCASTADSHDNAGLRMLPGVGLKYLLPFEI